MNAHTRRAVLVLSGVLCALAVHVAAIVLDDRDLYVTASSSALLLALATWLAARRSAGATRESLSPAHAALRLGSAIALFGAGVSAVPVALDALTPSAIWAVSGDARADALSDAGAPADTALRAIGDAWDGAGHVTAFAGVPGDKTGGKIGLLLRDGAFSAPLVRGNPALPAEVASLCDDGLPSIAYDKPRTHVLLAGIGGGVELACALRHGARAIDVAEPSAGLRALARRAGLGATRSAVHWQALTPRAFAARASTPRYDLVLLPELPTARTWPAGVLPLREATLETDAGLATLISALSNSGVLYATVTSEAAALRFVRTASAALQRGGIDHPERHFAVVQSGDRYGVVVRRSRFVLDDVLELYQRTHKRAPVQGSPWFGALVGGAERRPELRFMPGAMFDNRFGAVLAPVASAAERVTQRSTFDISPAYAARPLWNELSRSDLPGTWSKYSAARVLPQLTGVALLAVFVLCALAGRALAPSVGGRLRAWTTPALLACAQALAYAWSQHALALWFTPAHAFALAAFALACGAWAGCSAAARLLAHGRARLLSRTLALVAFGLVAATLEFVLARASASGVRASGAVACIGLGGLGAALTLPSAVALAQAQAVSPPSAAWLRHAHAAGLALAVPLAALLVLFASYNALAIAVALLLAVALLGALRDAR